MYLPLGHSPETAHSLACSPLRPKHIVSYNFICIIAFHTNELKIYGILVHIIKNSHRVISTVHLNKLYLLIRPIHSVSLSKNKSSVGS